MKSVGINLYSLRTLIQTEEGLTNTLLALKEMGYDYAQYSGAPFLPDAIKRASEVSGMPIVLTHVPLGRILETPEALAEEHATFGCRYIGLGSLPHEVAVDFEKLKAMAEALEHSAQVFLSRGCRLFFHNHHVECFRHGDITVLEYLMEHGPSMSFILDTYWLQYGGVSVADYVKRLSGRIACVHLKDYGITAQFTPTFMPVGDGNIDFPSLYPLMEQSGVEYYLVEQDNAVEFEDPLEQVRRSVQYMRRTLQ